MEGTRMLDSESEIGKRDARDQSPRAFAGSSRSFHRQRITASSGQPMLPT
jgi:hypothetical protein